VHAVWVMVRRRCHIRGSFRDTEIKKEGKKSQPIYHNEEMECAVKTTLSRFPEAVPASGKKGGGPKTPRPNLRIVPAEVSYLRTPNVVELGNAEVFKTNVLSRERENHHNTSMWSLFTLLEKKMSPAHTPVNKNAIGKDEMPHQSTQPRKK